MKLVTVVFRFIQKLGQMESIMTLQTSGHKLKIKMNESISLCQIRYYILIDVNVLSTNSNRFVHQHLFHKYLSTYYVYHTVDTKDTAVNKTEFKLE